MVTPLMADMEIFGNLIISWSRDQDRGVGPDGLAVTGAGDLVDGRR